MLCFPRLESNMRRCSRHRWVQVSFLYQGSSLTGRACQHGKSNSTGLYAIESTTKVLVSPSVGCRDHTRRHALHIYAQDALCVVNHTAHHCVCGQHVHHCSMLSVSSSETKIEHGKQFDIYALFTEQNTHATVSVESC